MAEIKPEIVGRFADALRRTEVDGEDGVAVYTDGFYAIEGVYDLRAALTAVADELRAEGFEAGVRAAASAAGQACWRYEGSPDEDRAAIRQTKACRDAILALLPPAAEAVTAYCADGQNGVTAAASQSPQQAAAGAEDPRVPALVAAVRWLLKIAPLGIAGDARKQADEHRDALARAEEDGRG